MTSELPKTAVAETLENAHNFQTVIGGKSFHGIVHGDIKPDNILVSQKGTSLVAMVTDFESSCVYGDESDLLTLPKTPPWNAPEWSDRYVRVKDAKLMDIYSFGLVCFWILFRSNLGKLPLSVLLWISY